jgi:predicted PurR-regulated permease PerM
MSDQLFQRILMLIGIITGVVLLTLFLVSTLPAWLVLFIGLMIAVWLRGLSDYLQRYLHISDKWSLGIVLLALTLLIIAISILFGTQILDQFQGLSEQLPESQAKIRDELEQQPWGKSLVERLESSAAQGGISQEISRYFVLTAAVLLEGIVVIFIGIFFAYDPDLYIRNFLRLFPKERRQRLRDTLAAANEALKKWLLSRFGSMVVVFIGTAIGLSVLGMPLIIPLSFISAISVLIPTFGPILSVIPAALLAFLDGPEQVLAVLIMYRWCSKLRNIRLRPLLSRKPRMYPLA